MLLNGRERTPLRTVTSLLIAILSLLGLGTAQAKIVVPANAVIEADDATVTSVVAMFERAEQAVKAHDLETLLSLYSAQYNYHGLKKDDVRKIWKDLFDEYKEIEHTPLQQNLEGWIRKPGRGRSDLYRSSVGSVEDQ